MEKNYLNDVEQLIKKHGLYHVMLGILAVAERQRFSMRSWNVIYENLSGLIEGVASELTNVS